MKRWMFAAVASLMRSIDSTQLKAMCGVKTTFGRASSFSMSMSFSTCSERSGTLALHKSSDPRQRLNVFVFPNAKIAQRDSTVPSHRSRLDEDERHTADGATAEMHQVPVVGKSVVSGILTHG